MSEAPENENFLQFETEPEPPEPRQLSLDELKMLQFHDRKGVVTNELLGASKYVQGALAAVPDVDTAMKIFGDLGKSLQITRGVEPETAAKVLRIAGELNFPEQFVNDNLPDSQEEAHARRIYNMLTQKAEDGSFLYPYTASFLSDPKHMAVARDRAEALAKLEGYIIQQYGGTSGRMSNAFTQSIKGIQRGFTSIAGVPAEVDIEEADKRIKAAKDSSAQFKKYAEEAKKAGNGAAYHRFNQLAERWEQSAEQAQRERGKAFRTFSGRAQQAARESEEYIPVYAPGRNLLERVVVGTAGVAPQLAMTTGVGLLTGGYGAMATMGAYIYGQTFRSLRDQGVSTDRARWAASINAGAQSLIEMFQFGQIRRLLRPGVSRGALEAAKSIGKTAGFEVLEEALQNPFEDLAQIMGEEELAGGTLWEQAQRGGARWIKGLPASFAQGLEEGLSLAPLVLFGGGGAQVMYDMQAAAQLRVQQAVDDAIATHIQNSGLSERAPKEARAYIEAIQRHTDIEGAFIPAETLREHFQSTGRTQIELDQVIDALGVREQWDESLTEGTQLEIEYPAWNQALSVEDRAALRPKIAYTLNGPTAENIAEREKEYEARFQQLEEEFQRQKQQDAIPQEAYDARDVLAEGFKEQQNIPAQDVDWAWRIVIGQLSVAARNRGETLTEFWLRRNVQVRWVDGKPAIILHAESEAPTPFKAFEKKEEAEKAPEKEEPPELPEEKAEEKVEPLLPEEPAEAEPKEPEKPKEPPIDPTRERLISVEGHAPVPVRVADISLSPEIPNQKRKASRTTGIVPGQELQGEYRDVPQNPIILWERLDGRLEIITGRHRWFHAKKTGKETIYAQIMKESEGFTAQMGMVLDAESNILDGSFDAYDTAVYIRATGLSEEQAERRGILRNAQGRDGFLIGKYAEADLYSAFLNGAIAQRKAAAIAQAAPNNESVQAAALAKADTMSAEELANYARILSSMSGEKVEEGGFQQLDLFGRDDSAMKQAEAVAKQIAKEVRALREVVRVPDQVMKHPKTAERLGIDLKDPDAIQKSVDEAKRRIYALEHAFTNPELYQELLKRAQEGGKGKTLYQAEAFHGSPHGFDKFSLEKIGTGEGAQAFGWGLYFTSEEDVARHYAEMGSHPTLYMDGVRIEWKIKDSRAWIRRAAEIVGTEKEKIISRLRDLGAMWAKEIGSEAMLARKQIAEAIKIASQATTFEMERGRNLYRTTLWEGKQENLLDWNEEISEENAQKIKAQAKKEGINLFGSDSAFVETVKGWGIVAAGDHRGIGGNVYRQISEILGSDKAASQFLSRAGIDGIRYPTGTLSGGSQEGYNYVVFDEEAIKIRQRELYQRGGVSPLGFYSALERAIQSMDFKQMPADQLLARIRKTPGIKAEEIEWTGVEDYIKAIGEEGRKVTKEEIVAFLKSNGVQVEEVALSDKDKTPEVNYTTEQVNELIHELIRDDLNEDPSAVMGDLTDLLNEARDEAWENTSEENKKEWGDKKNWENLYWSYLSDVEKLGEDRLSELSNDAYALYYNEYHDRAIEQLDDELPPVKETKYGDYTEPGGENYREVLLTLPGLSERYTSPHFPTKNVVAHFRLNDRIDELGKRVLFIEEIQSDWHQAGRRGGYKKEDLAALEKEAEPYFMQFYGRGKGDMTDAEWRELGNKVEEYSKRLNAAERGVPNAPFKNNAWAMLAFKRILRMAAESGYDSVAWTTGQMQSARYGGHGHEGLVSFYDRTLPNEVNKYIRKLDGSAKVRLGKIDSGPDTSYTKDEKRYVVRDYPGGQFVVFDTATGSAIGDEAYRFRARAENEAVRLNREALRDYFEVPTVTITDKMREKIMAGQALFQKRRPGIERGYVQFTSTGDIVNLIRRKADLSTVIHEFFHIWLEDTRQLIESGLASNEVIDDYNKIMEWANGDVELATSAYEAYVRGGKAPSVTLIEPFRGVSRWMRAIYANVEDLIGDADITDEVRGVFERSLASDTEVAEAEQWYTEGARIENFIKDMDEAERQRMEKVRQKAADAKSEDITQRRVKAFLRLKKSELKAQAKEEVSADALYVAIDKLIAAGGISTASAKADVGEPFQKHVKDIHNSLVKQNGSLTVEEAARQAGYESVDEFVSALANATKKSIAIEARYEEIAREAEARAMEIFGTGDAYHSEERLAVYEEEIAILEERIRRKSGERKPRKPVLRQVLMAKAREAQLRKPVREAMRYDKPTNEEHRALRDYDKAMRKGDYEDAKQHKMRAMISHARVILAFELRNQVAKDQRFIRRTLQKKKKPTILHEWLELIRDATFRWKLSDTPAMEPERLDDPNRLTDAVTGDVIPIPTVMPDWLMNRAESGDWKDLTVEKYAELMYSVRWLAQSGSQEARALRAHKGQTYKEAAIEAAAPMEGLKSAWNPEEGTLFRKPMDLFRTLMAGGVKLEFMMMMADGFRPDSPAAFNPGPNMKNFMDLRRATERAIAMKREKQTQIDDIIKRLGESVRRLESRLGGRLFSLEHIGVTPSSEMRLQGQLRWTGEKVFSMWVNMGNAQNWKALRDGYELTDEKLEAIKSLGETADWQLVQEIWDFYDEFYADTDSVHRRVEGVPMKKVEPWPVTVVTADGNILELRGGYSPIHVDGNLVPERAGKWTEKDDLMMRQDAIFQNPGVRKNHTMERQGTSLPPRLSMRVFTQHIADAIQYITHAEVVKDIDLIWRQPEFRTMFVEKFGDKAYKVLRPALKSIARPGGRRLSDGEQYLESVRQLGTLWALAGKTLVGVRQTGSLPAGIRKIGMANFLYGMYSALRHPIETNRYINERSPIMRERFKHYSRNVADAISVASGQSSLFRRAITKGREIGMILIPSVDWFVTNPLWMGAHHGYLTTHKGDLSGADEYANHVITSTQPSGAPIDRIAFQRSDSMLVRMLLGTFQGFMAVHGNNMRYYWRGTLEGKIPWKERVRYLAYDIAAASVMIEVLISLLRDGDLPDEEELAIGGAAYITQWMPVVSQAVSYMRYRRTPGEHPMWEGFNKTFQAAERMLAENKNKKESQEWRVAYLLGQAAEFWTGVPAFRATNTFLKGWDELSRGETGNPFRLVIPSYGKK